MPQNELGRHRPPTWKDPKTGLEWQCQSPGEMTWHEAQEYAKSLSLDGKHDWRLTNLSELESLLDRTRLVQTEDLYARRSSLSG